MKINHLFTLAITTLLVSATAIANAQEIANAQVCNEGITRAAPDARFKDLGNGEVEDLNTGLVWQRCSIGQTWSGSECTGSPESLTWQQALNKAKAVGKDYRLPNLKEVASLNDMGCQPAINTTYFPDIPQNGYYWTSTPLLSEGRIALLYSFYEAHAFINNVPQLVDKTKSSIMGYYKMHAIAVRNK